MAKVRIGFSTAFELENELVGIGTDNPTNTFQALGNIRSSNAKAIGVSTFTTFDGFTDTKLSLEGSAGAKQHTTSGEIIIEGEVTVSSGTTYRSGVDHLTVTDNFTLPGISDDKPSAGTTRFNENLVSLEFYTGSEWRAVNSYIDMGSRGRGLVGGGANPADTSLIESLEMSTEGSAANFGDRTVVANNPSGCSSSIRGLYCGGNPASDVIDYVTIASKGDAVDFGNLTNARFSTGSCGSSTRGLTGGGNPNVNIIDYVEIATIGNSIDFGDLISAQYGIASASSPTRGFWLGGTSDDATMQYVTIASTGNAIDFGHLTTGNRNGRACSNTTRLVKGGGGGSGPDVIDYITMASLGNATRFGDLIASHTEFSASFSSQTRGFWCAGRNPNNTTLIQKVEIATTGNAESFGDMGTARQKVAGLSDSHGGLGGF